MAAAMPTPMDLWSSLKSLRTTFSTRCQIELTIESNTVIYKSFLYYSKTYCDSVLFT